MLLKSCAIPPASVPSASSFCDWRSCDSRRRFSVMSLTTPMNRTAFPSLVVHVNAVGGNPPHSRVIRTHDPVLATKRHVRGLCMLQRALYQLPVFRRDLLVDHAGVQRYSRLMADDRVKPVVPDSRAAAQIVIEERRAPRLRGRVAAAPRLPAERTRLRVPPRHP